VWYIDSGADCKPYTTPNIIIGRSENGAPKLRHRPRLSIPVFVVLTFRKFKVDVDTSNSEPVVLFVLNIATSIRILSLRAATGVYSCGNWVNNCTIVRSEQSLNIARLIEVLLYAGRGGCVEKPNVCSF
jgi:hypothetical protein